MFHYAFKIDHPAVFFPAGAGVSAGSLSSALSAGVAGSSPGVNLLEFVCNFIIESQNSVVSHWIQCVCFSIKILLCLRQKFCLSRIH